MASGDTLLIWDAKNADFPASNYATHDTRNQHPVLDFDPTTDETAYFPGVLPRHYAGGGLTLSYQVMFSTAVAGVGRFEAAIERHDASGLDLDADSFAAAQSSGVTAPGTSGQVVVGTIAFTNGAQMDSLAVGESFRLLFRRDADGTTGTDDASGDAELLRLELRET